MALFELRRCSKSDDKKIAKKSNKKAVSQSVSVKGGILGRINEIKAKVQKNLGKYKDDYLIISTMEQLKGYFDRCVYNGVISIDTETTGLNPLEDKIVGLCIYTPKEPAAYVPINHTSYITGARVSGQLKEEEVAKELGLLLANCENLQIIMFNAKFDIRVIRNQLGVKNIYCTWDCYLASRLLNENEEHKGLKALHNKYVLKGVGDAFSFDELFKGVSFDKIPVNIGYLYAAHDAIITYELYQFQLPYLDTNNSVCKKYGLQDVSWVFHTIEMPCVKVVCDMEDNGVKFDFEYQQKLSEKYNKLLDEAKNTFYKMCDGFVNEDMWAYKKQNPNHKLDDPINIDSPTQLAILFYDILKYDVVDKNKPRGTGEDILHKLDTDFTRVILKYREVAKLISTYIDKMPECVQKDGRIHCSFNQYGADTGRFSSSDPNLQNIPSHNKDIRKMFVATNEEKLVSTDTQQFVVDRWCEVECADKWKYADKIVAGDILLLEDGSGVNVVNVDIQLDKVVIDFR